jgi:hypothetical protein
MSRPAPRACSSSARPLASNARDNIFGMRRTNLFFDAVDCMQVIRCGRENDEGVGWGETGVRYLPFDLGHDNGGWHRGR